MSAGAESEKRDADGWIEHGGYRIHTVTPKERTEQRRVVENLQKVFNTRKVSGYFLHIDLAHFYPGGAVPKLVREAADYHMALLEWAAVLETTPEKLDRQARLVADKTGITDREALDKCGRAASLGQKQIKLSELPVLGPIYRRLAVPPYNNRAWRREMKRRLKRAKGKYRGKN